MFFNIDFLYIGKTGYIDYQKPELVTGAENIIFNFNGFYEKC